MDYDVNGDFDNLPGFKEFKFWYNEYLLKQHEFRDPDFPPNI